MKKFLFLLTSLLMFAFSTKAQYNIKVDAPQMAGQKATLAFHFNGQLRVADTVWLDPAGTGYFRNSGKKLARGLYMLYFTPTVNMEMLIGGEQNFGIQCDTTDMLQKAKIEGSSENEAFLRFQRFLNKANREGKEISEQYAKLSEKEKKERQEEFTGGFNELDRKAKNYVDSLARHYPGSALATFTRFIMPVEPPDFSKEVPEGTPDRDKEIQQRAWYYAKSHYWDHADLTDSVLIYTPTFKPKLDAYFKNMIYVHPDSLYNACVDLIEKARPCKIMFRYLTEYCLEYTFSNKIMGMDEAFVKFGHRYYLSGEAYWAEEKQMKTIKEEVYKRQYNLLNHKAYDLKFPTLEGNWASLYETDAPFILLMFWEPNCGHCKKQVPLAKKEIYDRFGRHGLKVFSVNIHTDKKAWEDFIEKYELFDFINCWDPKQEPTYRTLYNVFSTPVMYILDKEKKIIAKSLTVEQMTDLLKHEYEKMGVEVQ